MLKEWFFSCEKMRLQEKQKCKQIKIVIPPAGFLFLGEALYIMKISSIPVAVITPDETSVSYQQKFCKAGLNGSL